MKQALRFFHGVLAATALMTMLPAQATFFEAKQHAKPVGCPSGSFWDARNGGECWACTGDYVRPPLPIPVDDPKACWIPTGVKESQAVFVKKAGCPGNQFAHMLDLSSGIQCWSCDTQYERSVFDINGDKACRRPPREEFDDAKWHRDNTYAGQGCPGSQIWDLKRNDDKGLLGACWSCKSGFERTGHSIAGNKACVNKYSEKWDKANKHGKATCSAGQDFDPRNGGECWKCDTGAVRNANAVTDAKSCTGVIEAKYKRADFKNKFAILAPCPTGQFFDPRNGGECWSCPAPSFRSVAAVTDKKACTDKPLEFFATDAQGLCRSIIGGLNKGEKGLEEISKLIDPVMNTIRRPLDNAVATVSRQINSPAELDALLNQVASKIDKPVIEIMGELKATMMRAGGALDDILLDANLMCGGDHTKIQNRIIALGLRPNIGTKSSSFTDFFVKDAYAASNTVYSAYSVGGYFIHPQYKVGYSFGISFVTNFASGAGFIFNTGPLVTSDIGAGLNFGVMIFPSTTLAAFRGEETAGGVYIPSAGISVGGGEKLKKFYSNFGTIGKILPDTIDLSIDPTFKTWPGIGVSKSVGISPKGSKGNALNATGSVSWAIPIQTWGN